MTRRQLNALEKARAKDISRIVHHARADGTLNVYHVASDSNPSDVHTVCLSFAGGRAATACSCPAGQHGYDCWHVAAVLLYAGFPAPPAGARHATASDYPESATALRSACRDVIHAMRQGEDLDILYSRVQCLSDAFDLAAREGIL